MKILISADMEGISGVVTSDHTSSSHKEYERFRKLMTAEANAAIEGALAGGADQIVVNDSHGKMANILIEELNPAAELISGSPKPFGMMQGMGPEVDAVFFVGYHAASGTGAAVLEHTWSGHVIELRLNSIKPLKLRIVRGKVLALTYLPCLKSLQVGIFREEFFFQRFVGGVDAGSGASVDTPLFLGELSLDRLDLLSDVDD